jgi:hypothetical protein
MLPRRCKHCQHVYMPKAEGLARVFCLTCVRECERAYARILDYTDVNPNLPVTEIITTLGIHRDYVYQLIALGKLTPDLSSRHRPEKRLCVICRAPLGSSEDVYCSPCNDTIDRRLHVRYSPPTAAKRRPDNQSPFRHRK